MRQVTAGLFSSIDGVVEAPGQWQPAFGEEMGAVLPRMPGRAGRRAARPGEVR
jgi:hypothetical protein